MEGKLKSGLLLSVLFALISGPCAAEDGFSGNSYITGCAIVTQKKDFSATERIKEGMCIGTVSAVIGLGARLQESARFCIPESGIPVEQGIRVFLKFLADNPSRTNESAINLVLEAFRAAWPCH